MRKLFIFDLDGTLLNDNQQILPQTKNMLKKARQHSHVLVIATGRPYQDIIKDVDETIFDYLICNNGAYLYDVKKSKFHYFEQVDKLNTQVIIDIFKKYEGFLAIHGEKRAHRTSLLDFNHNDNIDSFVKGEFAKFNNYFISSEEIIEFANAQKIMQISLLHHNEKNILAIKDQISKLINNVKIHIANNFYLDINPYETSKYSGLTKLMNLLAESFQVYAFGDSSNDLELLQGAHFSYCMENGNDDAKKAAKEVIGSNRTLAIAHKLDEII